MTHPVLVVEAACVCFIAAQLIFRRVFKPARQGRTPKESVMSNPFASIEGFFVNLFKGIFSSSQAKAIEQNIAEFVKTDIGALAVAAVEYVETEMPGADNVAKRDAAVAKLKTDAATAGKDLSSLALSTLNWFIETALQAVLTKAVAA